MRKKITLLIMTATLLWMGTGGKIWGQTIPNAVTGGPYSTSTYYCDQNYTIASRSWGVADNNFGPGESGIIRPFTTTVPSYSGYWTRLDGTNSTSPDHQPFATGNGVITVGNTNNTVGNWMNIASYTAQCPITYTDLNGNSFSPTISNALYGPTAVVGVPDGTGQRWVSPTAASYSYDTEIQVNSTTLTSDNPWLLQQFNFENNPWFYYSYSLYSSAGFCVNGPYNNYVGGVYSGQVSCSIIGVRYESDRPRGGYKDGIITLIAGSHVHLDGSHAASGGRSIRSATTGAGATGSNSLLQLPAGNTTVTGHYTLMNDQTFDASSTPSGTTNTSFTVSGINPLGANAVMGINTQFVPGTPTSNQFIRTNTVGGTILIGSATDAASQAAMIVQAATTNTPNAGNDTTFIASNTTGSLTSYLGYSLPRHGTANLGNYGDNDVTILVPSTGTGLLPTTLGAGALQVYNHATGNANALTFAADATYTPTINGAGNLLIEGYGNVNFNATDGLRITGSAAGNATINGAHVNFNGTHTYSGTAAGDYGVYTYTSFSPPFWSPLYDDPSSPCSISVNLHSWTNPSNQTSLLSSSPDVYRNYQYGGDKDVKGSFSGDGDIVVAAGQTINIGHSGSGSLRWQATRDISTANTTTTNVTFTRSGAGLLNWQAKQDIQAGGNVSFTVSGSGNAFWQAERDIITLAPTPLGSYTSTSFTLNGTNSITAWQAGGNIETNDKIIFDNSGPSNVYWQAGGFIRTNDTIRFANSSTGNTMWYAKDSIFTYGGEDTERRMVVFTETGSGKTLWWAELGEIVTNNCVHFDHSGAAAGSDISWWAGTDIIVSRLPNAPTAPNNRLLIDFATNDTIELHAKEGFIRTNAQVDINRTNTGAGYTFIHAGCNTYNPDNNIQIENIFNYTESPPSGSPGPLGNSRVTLRAENDILSNTVEDHRPAPITFTAGAGSQTTTLWDAERNINTKGRVEFQYRNPSATTMGPLTWLSRGGYIQTERPVQVFYDSNNTISFLAENMVADLPTIPPAHVDEFNSTGRRGNIHSFDSILIVRSNAGAGLTQFRAENHIWTAMFDYVDQASTGNSLEIISHYGDIYLGHNDGTNVDQAYQFYLSSLLAVSPGFQLTQANPSKTLDWEPQASDISYDLNNFNYTVNLSNTAGHLWIKAGYLDTVLSNIPRGGGNIYFTHKNIDLASGTNHDTEVSIPFSNWYVCSDPAYGTHDYYEKSGIIGGVARCAINSSNPLPANTWCDSIGLNYSGYHGNLLFNTNRRGNIIINNGSYLDFKNGNGNAQFLTQEGDIDMRYPFDAKQMQGSLLFYANSLLPDKLEFDPCACLEKTNNVYLQDFKYTPVPGGAGNSGSVFIGADNNIKLQYGGLKTINNEFDPFINGMPYPCVNGQYHCNSDTTINKARDLILDFTATNSGGFAAVASDLIDVYKKIHFYGGTGSGMGAVPGYPSLHGENVSGYGLFIKSQGNKKNWTRNAFDILGQCEKGCPDQCDDAFLHNIARITFHSDARFYTQNTRSYIGGPVVESYGNFELNTSSLPVGTSTSLRIQTDSLIVHDSLVIDGPKTVFSTWSALDRNMPVIKLGHHRFTPPFAEDGTYCKQCAFHEYGEAGHGLDTLVVTFRNDASIERLHTLVADHTVLTFLTDSFDHKNGNPTLDARFFTDIFKVRNQVELWGNPPLTHSGHFELISEAQMKSKDYSGIFARQLHMEPIAPDCKFSNRYSDLWITDPALDVISSTRFGGFGTLHADVHVETQAVIAPGYASLGVYGNCYEQMSGTLKMNDLRLDKGAELHFSIGDVKGFDDWETDILEVDSLTLYGTVNVFVEVRCQQKFTPGCYPIILYKAVGEQNLNHLLLGTFKLGEYQLSLDFETTPGVVYLCVGQPVLPMVQREVIITEPPTGVSVYPLPGVHYVPWGNSFTFSVTYGGPQYLIQTSRTIDNGGQETLIGVMTANNEFEYTIPFVKTQPLYVYIGPRISVENEFLYKDAAVWSFGNTLYINVEQKDIASIYSVTGMLVKRIEIPDGGTSFPMQRGVFIVTLKDGSVHKVIIN